MSNNITQILNNSEKDKITPEIYNELVKLARSSLNKSQRFATLDTSAVVHESLIKFYNKKSLNFQSRSHFYALMVKIMRDLIIDYARNKKAQIRGGDLVKVTLTGISVNDEKQDMELSHLLDLDKAMQKLADFDIQLEQILAMKFYAGLTITDLAKCFDVSESTIKRELRTARAFVKSKLPDY